MGTVLQAITDSFASLATQFRMRIESADASPPVFRQIYLNTTTGMEVVVDWAEFRPFVWLYRLEEGRLPAQQEARVGEPLTCIDVDDVLYLRSCPKHPAGKMLSRADLEALAPLLAEYADAVRRHCADVLEGDFAIFETLRPVVEARIRQRFD
jgi:hypothetical protein